MGNPAPGEIWKLPVAERDNDDIAIDFCGVVSCWQCAEVSWPVDACRVGLGASGQPTRRAATITSRLVSARGTTRRGQQEQP